ncbi:MAG: hypothetical protein R3298_03500 [Gammaproteobacteria bacterium]|nr:hypothetical protein [Gammaproteobacteria bacterium]
MSILLIGLALFALMVLLFWAKNLTRKAWLARLAYSEPVARLTLIALAMILLGTIATVADWLG